MPHARTKAAAGSVGMSTDDRGLLLPARPTRITPVLVTAGAGLDAFAGLVTGEALMPLAAAAAAAEDSAAEVDDDDVAVVADALIPVLAAGFGAVDIAAADVWVRGGWAVVRAVVGVVATLPATTVMVTDGLPAPQLAATVYVPRETVAAIVALPVKFSEPTVIEADPPTNAVEWTPVSTEPFVGQTPRIETVWPGAALPGFTISWP